MERRDLLGAMLAVFCGIAFPWERESLRGSQWVNQRWGPYPPDYEIVFDVSPGTIPATTVIGEVHCLDDNAEWRLVNSVVVPSGYEGDARLAIPHSTYVEAHGLRVRVRYELENEK